MTRMTLASLRAPKARSNLYNGLLRRLYGIIKAPRNDIKEIAGVIFLLTVLMGNALFLRFNAFRCFNFFDMGGFLDASWRIFYGQQPYVDFIYTTGPVHLYMNAFFFWLFGGFGKTAILAHLIVVDSMVITAAFLMVRRRIPLFAVMLVILLTMTCFYWPISHPWYDQSAHLWGILAVAVLAGQFLSRESRSIFGISVFCGVMAVTSLMAKTNVGLAYGIMFLIVFLVSSERIQGVGGYLLGGLTGLIVFAILIGHPEKYFEQVIASYGLHKSGRLAELLRPGNWLVNFYWLPAIMATVFILPVFKRYKELLALFLGTIFVAIFSTYTSNLIRPPNVPLWGVIMGLAFILFYAVQNNYSAGQRRLFHQGAIFVLSVFCLGLIGLFVHYGVALKVWTYLRPNPVGNYALRTKALEGWLCEREEGELFDEMADYIKQYVPSKDALLILGDMQILYAATKRESYRGVPFIFQADDLPVPGRQVQEVRENILRNPPDWILWNMGEPTFGKNLMHYLGLWETIRTDYSPSKQWRYHVLLKRNPV